MAERKAATKAAPKPARKPVERSAATDDTAGGFTEEERAAVRERARELKAAKRAGGARDAGDEAGVLAKLAAMPPADRALGERVHAIVRASAPDLVPKLWYGMPAYAKHGKVVCFFQDAAKFKARYATLGFSDTAALDDGQMWPTSFALTALTSSVETRIAELVKRAAAG